ncbi:DNA ligase [Encephalitozoon intestinalis ATCC 50506]|uniref:DNA ligase n=1 Tax=Encephalitozoon intestinalis (strain ATCC 50506) TaxID=876142 RepID=E0S5Y0_ENCIT|nr:DNA ligase [Encephalitozoon intestinalis ATCC 50506]ADM11115.1 DNA ligase [Encephalitozoon intestinalis ATCC 50506]UTX44769.1 DNA ligase [Encephalitozoon intestinalis]
MSKILFVDFCTVLERINQTTKRLEIQSILTDYLKDVHKIDPPSLAPVLYLFTATVYPEYFNKELGVGENTLINVVAELTGKSAKNVKKEYSKEGDLGTIAMKCRVSQLFVLKTQLEVMDVFLGMRKVANEGGQKSSASKKRIILGMMVKCSPLESKYLIRLIEGRLKVGLALKTVLISLANAFSSDKADEVKAAFNRQPDIGRLAECILEYGVEGLPTKFQVSPGVPLKPMLANPSKDLTSAFKKVENKNFTCEYKYDGERIQIHKFGNRIETFSRNSEKTTEKYPDLMDLYNISDRDFIIDGEIVAYDRKERKILPFQILTTRKRKRVESSKIDVQVCVFGFDLIYFDGKTYIDEPFEERRKILHSSFKEMDGKFQFTEFKDCETPEESEMFFNESVEKGFEGMMIKILGSDATYLPSQRSNKWIKIKKDYLEGMSDSLDLVVMGAYYGKGKRAGFYGGFLLGVYNDEEEKFEALCKIGTGFDDNILSRLYEQLSSNLCSAPKNYSYKESVKPDVWVEAKYVWEVKAAGLSLSPIYNAGGNRNEKGISLRFPRFLREREDKDVKEVTTSSQIYQMYLDSKVENSEEFY